MSLIWMKYEMTPLFGSGEMSVKGRRSFSVFADLTRLVQVFRIRRVPEQQSSNKQDRELALESNSMREGHVICLTQTVLYVQISQHYMQMGTLLCCN